MMTEKLWYVAYPMVKLTEHAPGACRICTIGGSSTVPAMKNKHKLEESILGQL